MVHTNQPIMLAAGKDYHVILYCSYGQTQNLSN